MSNFEKQIENYHLKYYGKVDNEQFIQKLHQRVKDKNINKYSRYLLLLLFFAFSLLRISDSKNIDNFYNDSDLNFYSGEQLEVYSDSTYMNNLYFLELEEAFFAIGEIWYVLEFLDEIKIEEEYQHENYN